MTRTDPYSNAHLAVAAIRVLTHQQGSPPSIDAVGRMLSFSGERIHSICRRIEEMGIIEVVEGAFGTRLFVRDHVRIEELPREEADGEMAQAVREFQQARQGKSKEIESFKARQAKKQQDLFAELNQKLKDGLGRKT